MSNHGVSLKWKSEYQKTDSDYEGRREWEIIRRTKPSLLQKEKKNQN